MFLSICIPTYNRAHTIIRTLDSLSVQTCTDFEIIIVDDGSVDNTENIIKTWKSQHDCFLYYIRKDNGGKHTALNVGIKKAVGDYFLILDSDDCLLEDAVEFLRDTVIQNSIEKNNKVCGVIARCATLNEHELIGDAFETPNINYIDFHFRHKKHYKDCCECIKTEILKKFEWPEPKGTHFVPESFVFDQIGLEYDLLCTNRIIKYIEYQEDGITRNVREYKKKNAVGYLFDYVSKLEDIFPKCKNISIKKKILFWTLYWDLVSIDLKSNGPRVKHISPLGHLTKIFFPIIRKKI